MQFDDDGNVEISALGRKQPIGVSLKTEIVGETKLVLVGILGACGVMSIKTLEATIGHKLYVTVGGFVANSSTSSPSNPQCVGVSLGNIESYSLTDIPNGRSVLVSTQSVSD